MTSAGTLAKPAGKPFACCRPGPVPRRCVMSAGIAARRQRWHNTAAWSLLFFVLPLLVSMAQGGHQELAVHVGEDRRINGGGHAVEQQQQLSRLLGSRPPCCDHKCGACTPCKAVQVRASAAAERERPLCANYEPVGWKCRCGAAVFDP